MTESDQFSIEEFIPLLRERMHVLSPQVRQFLVGWITVLDSVPDIDMLGFLPDFLDGEGAFCRFLRALSAAFTLAAFRTVQHAGRVGAREGDTGPGGQRFEGVFAGN